MMEDPVNYNGEITDGNSIGFNQIKRGFNFGDGLFESIRVFNGECTLLETHFNRMLNGLKILKISFNYSFNLKSLNQYIDELLIYKNIKLGGKIKVYVFRSGLGTYKPETNQISFLIEASYLEDNKYILNKKGFLVNIYKEYTKPINKLSTFKSSSSLLYVLASISSKENNLDDHLILNEKNKIIESTNSNIFLLIEDNIITPSVESGCINGVMRLEIIKIIKELGINIVESNIEKEDLRKAKEIFLSNVINGIIWVGGYESKRYYNLISKKIIENLNNKLIINRV
jgi:branched-chain amino acid aminotransferase